MGKTGDKNKESEREPTMVLVGTYRPVNEEWVKGRKLYNLPLPKCGKVAFHDRISRIVLIVEGCQTEAYAAKLKAVVGRDWLKSNGYRTATVGRGVPTAPHGDKYALYELGEKLSAAKVLSDASADVFVSFSRCPNIRIDAAFYAKPYPRTGGKSMPYIFDKLKPYFKKWHSGRTFDPEDERNCAMQFVMLERKDVLSSGADERIIRYIHGNDFSPLFICGESLAVLKEMPDSCIDCCMTSPPYWNKRQYLDGGIGLEPDFRDFIDNLIAICAEIKRVLKPTGSFWLNIGDSYLEKNLLNIPSRVAIRLQDEQGWILRNTIIWNKVKGCPDNSIDKLRNIYEPIFHFVKKSQGYYYDVDTVRHKPRQAKVVKGTIVSATGVSGVKYRRKIEMSTVLTDAQKRNAMMALERILEQIQDGEISDFRMIIKGEQRTTHSDAEAVSGRARELHEKGFYFLKYNPKGGKPSDLWEIIPEDTQGRESHFAPYPEDLCKMPIQLSCPKGGVVLDPFSGTGTTAVVARALYRKSIGIDISKQYIDDAQRRIDRRFAQGLLAL